MHGIVNTDIYRCARGEFIDVAQPPPLWWRDARRPWCRGLHSFALELNLSNSKTRS